MKSCYDHLKLKIIVGCQFLFSSNIIGLLFAGHSSEDGNYKEEKLWSWRILFLIDSIWGTQTYKLGDTVVGGMTAWRGSAVDRRTVEEAGCSSSREAALGESPPTSVCRSDLPQWLCCCKLNRSLLCPLAPESGDEISDNVVEWDKNTDFAAWLSPKLKGHGELYQGDAISLAQRAQEGS